MLPTWQVVCRRRGRNISFRVHVRAHFIDGQLYLAAEPGQRSAINLVVQSNLTYRQSTTIVYIQEATKLDDCLSVTVPYHPYILHNAKLQDQSFLEPSLHSFLLYFFPLYPTVSALLVEYPFKQNERMHFTNIDSLLLLLTTLQCATGVFCRSYGGGKLIDITKLTTNAARMRAGFPPLKPKNLKIPSRVKVGGKIKSFYFILIPISFACF